MFSSNRLTNKLAKKLANYVRKNTLFAILAVTVILWLFNISLAFMGELSQLKNDYTFMQALQYVFWRSPSLLNQYLPMAALMGAVIGLGNLASHSEVTVIRASGISIYRLVFWVAQSVCILILLAWLLNQFVLPYSSQQAKRIKHPTSSSLTNEVSGYWLKYASKNKTNSTVADNNNFNKDDDDKHLLADNHNILHLDYANAKGDMTNLTIWHVDSNNRITTVLNANKGIHQKAQQWQLNHVSVLSIKPDGSSSLSTNAHMVKQLPLEPKYIYLMTQDANNLSITDLYMYNGYLEENNKNSRKYQLVFWDKILSPLAMISLAMIACSFIFGSTRQQSMGARIVIAILCGILFRYLQNLTNYMALAFDFPVIAFILIPILVSTVIGVLLLNRN